MISIVSMSYEHADEVIKMMRSFYSSYGGVYKRLRGDFSQRRRKLRQRKSVFGRLCF